VPLSLEATFFLVIKVFGEIADKYHDFNIYLF
jgi:hypothetical protein